MIFFKPLSENDSVKNAYSDLNAAENSAVIAAFDGERRIGSCRVFVSSYKCVLSEITVESEDSLLVEGLIRSALNYAANRGAYTAECLDSTYKSVLDLLGFEFSDSKYIGEIPELLKGSCCK